MDLTKAVAERGGQDAEAPADAEAERDRARLYLDLWERQLVHAAAHGRVAAGMRPPPR